MVMRPSQKSISNVCRVMVILVLLSQLFPLSSAGADSPEDLYNKAREKYRSLRATPQKQWNRQDWTRCLLDLEQVIQQDSKEKFLDKCYYLIAQSYHALYDAYRESQDFDSALKYYRKLVAERPTSNLADDAQYAIGMLYMEKDPALAYPEFVKVGVLFPDGDMVRKARRKVAQLEKRLGCKPDPQGSARVEKKLPESAPLPPSSPSDSPSSSLMLNKKLSTVRPSVAQIEEVQHWSAEDYSRVAIYVSAPVKFEQHTLPPEPGSGQPAKIYLDLKECVVGPEMKTKFPIMDGFLQGVRVGQFATDQSRVVLDIDSIETFKVFSLTDPFRLVVDVRGKRSKTVRVETPEPKPKSEKPESEKSEKKKTALPHLVQQLKLGVKRIVIDPGHGGKDSGAVGPNGVYEKDVVLGIALHLKQVLESQLGCEVFLTRNCDEFLSLEKRTAIANMKKADLFISLHVNAHKDSNVHGIETYYLNFANDAEAARVAAFENSMSTKKLSDLEAILHDLMFNMKVDESSRLAREVQGRMVDELKKTYEDVRDLGVKHAPFYVLLGAEMPCILIETAFISNPTEEQRLKDEAFQKDLAGGIAGGVQSYIKHMEQVARAGD